MKDPRFLSRYGVKVNTSLAEHTVIGLGGNADFFLQVSDGNQLKLAARAAHENGLKVCVIGRGTHTVFSSHGFRGLVIKNEIDDFEILNGVATVGSGLALTQVIHRLAEESCGGFEELADSPRSIGGAVSRNTRVGKTSVEDHLTQVSLYSKGRVLTVQAQDMAFEPNSSRVQYGDEYVLSASFRVRKEPREDINKRILGATQLRLRNRPGASRAIRVFADLDGQTASELARQVGMAGERVGGAVISTKDPNYIINEGAATPEDIYELAQRIKNRVSLKTHEKLREAITWAGEW